MQTETLSWRGPPIVCYFLSFLIVKKPAFQYQMSSSGIGRNGRINEDDEGKALSNGAVHSHEGTFENSSYSTTHYNGFRYACNRFQTSALRIVEVKLLVGQKCYQ